MIIRKVLIPLIVVVLCLSYGAAYSFQETKAIKAGKILTITNGVITNGIIIIKDGKIVDVGKNIEVPEDALVIDAGDKVVMPGMIEAHSTLGLQRQNENVPNVPFVNIIYSILPSNRQFEDALRDGYTAIHVNPGNNTLIGGQGVVVKPLGYTIEKMLIKREVSMKISLLPRNTRMGTMAQLFKTFDDIKDYMKEIEEKKTEGKEEEVKIDPKKEAMIRLMEGKLTAFTYCSTPTDVLNAIKLKEKYGINMVLVLGVSCYRVADVIAEKKLMAVLPPEFITWETDPNLETDVIKVLPVILSKAGVKFSFQSDPSSISRRYLWYEAAEAVKYGMNRDEALKSITLYPAQTLGLDSRMGSIERGKDADLLILKGDPLDIQTWVDKVFIEGKEVYDRKKDKKLSRIFHQ